ncbi:conserved hypothetical protein [Ricinus communis]|uniref:Uncharacterized protein n=1 Tax=Ricinus communis TaxID=3988 RepID=B9SUJ0_RICCO|nr:conserved hypothetical protein [Ricinus communis]
MMSIHENCMHSQGKCHSTLYHIHTHRFTSIRKMFIGYDSMTEAQPSILSYGHAIADIKIRTHAYRSWQWEYAVEAQTSYKAFRNFKTSITFHMTNVSLLTLDPTTKTSLLGFSEASFSA